MAYSNFGTFLPSEENYRTGAEYENAIKGQAYQKATYLSSMDQFYVGLEESARQFSEGMTFKREELSENVRLTERSQNIQENLGLKDIALRWELGLESIAVQKELGLKEVEVKERTLTETMGLSREQLAQQQEQFETTSLFQEKALDVGTGLKLTELITQIATADISGKYGVSAAKVGNESDIFDWIMGGGLVAGTIYGNK